LLFYDPFELVYTPDFKFEFKEKQELPPFKYFSPSSLKEIRHCPFKYMCSKLHLPKIITANKGRDFGNVIHDSIEEYYQKHYKGKTTKDVLENIISKLIKKRWVNYDLRMYEKKRDRCIDEWVKFEIKRISNPENLKHPAIAEGTMHDTKNKRLCRVDFYNNGVIVDWKTGKFDKFDEEMIIQGKYNEMVMEALGYDVKTVMFLILGQDNFIPLPYVSSETIIKMEKEAHELIAKGIFQKRPSYLCSYCDFNIFCQLHERKESIWSAFL